MYVTSNKEARFNLALLEIFGFKSVLEMVEPSYQVKPSFLRHRGFLQLENVWLVAGLGG
jgi:hypothetical protein